MAYGVINSDLMTTSDGVSSAGLYGFKNRLINSDMRIDQRNAGASVTPVSGQYLVDRWFYGATQTSKFTAQQNAGSVTPPTGYSKYLGFTSSSAYSITSTDIFHTCQIIEGLNTIDLAWGTASAAAVTLSFWVRSSLTGTFGGCITNYAGNRSYPFTYTISAANTFERKTITIPGDTTGTWLTTNSGSISLFFGLGVGSTYSGTAGAWAATQYYSATGATSVVGTNGATFYITGVQLEKGSTATSFDYRPYGTELALCQRYYYVMPNFYIEGYAAAANQRAVTIPVNFPVTMRATPTRTVITAGTYTNVRGSSSTYAGLGLVGLNATFTSAAIEAAGAGYTQCSNQTESMSAEL